MRYLLRYLTEDDKGELVPVGGDILLVDHPESHYGLPVTIALKVCPSQTYIVASIPHIKRIVDSGDSTKNVLLMRILVLPPEVWAKRNRPGFVNTLSFTN